MRVVQKKKIRKNRILSILFGLFKKRNHYSNKKTAVLHNTRFLQEKSDDDSLLLRIKSSGKEKSSNKEKFCKDWNFH